jgi:hypothetical protein
MIDSPRHTSDSRGEHAGVGGAVALLTIATFWPEGYSITAIFGL